MLLHFCDARSPVEQQFLPPDLPGVGNPQRSALPNRLQPGHSHGAQYLYPRVVTPSTPCQVNAVTVQERRNNAAGFTLIEMIVVLVVLALVGSIVLARGPMHSPTLDLRAGARSIASDMRLARSAAIAGDRDVVFTIDATDRTYGPKPGRRRGIPASIQPVLPANPVVFHPDGSASGGHLEFTEQDSRIGIAIDWLTGRVVVQ